MDGFAIQVSIKPGEPALINVRADDWGTFASLWAEIVPHLPRLATGQPLDGVTLVQQELGGQVIAEHPAPPMPPTPPPGPTVPQSWAPPQQTWQQPASTPGVCGRCQKTPVCGMCGRVANPVAKALKGGAYWIHDCAHDCKGRGSGQWCNEPKP